MRFIGNLCRLVGAGRAADHEIDDVREVEGIVGGRRMTATRRKLIFRRKHITEYL